MTLNVDKKNALKAWREADNKGKQMLENLYGKEIFANQNVMDRIKTFEDAMEETGRKGVPDFSDLPKDMRRHFIALYKMEVITEALNEGWKADWDNSDENKYYPYFIMSPSSFAFRDSDSGLRLRLRVAGLAFVIKHANLRNIRQNNLLTFGNTSR